jgi:hypothetical protein
MTHPKKQHQITKQATNMTKEADGGIIKKTQTHADSGNKMNAPRTRRARH